MFCLCGVHVCDVNLVNGGFFRFSFREPDSLFQNGRVVGAVTHILVNDPTRGYGIFIENMLEAAE